MSRFASYSVGVRKELPTLVVNLNEGLNNLEIATRLYISEKFGPTENLVKFESQLTALIAGLTTGRAGLDKFRAVISGLPTFTANFRKAQHTSYNLLSEINAALTAAIHKAGIVKGLITKTREAARQSEYPTQS